MSLSAPPRCSLFVPVPGSEQLALVKELHLWNAISVEQVNVLPLSASIHLYPSLLLFPSLSLFPHSLFSPCHSLSFPPSNLRGISLYLQLSMLRRAQGEAWHSLSTIQSISERVFLYFCLPRCSTCQQTTTLTVLAVRGNTANARNK